MAFSYQKVDVTWSDEDLKKASFDSKSFSLLGHDWYWLIMAPNSAKNTFKDSVGIFLGLSLKQGMTAPGNVKCKFALLAKAKDKYGEVERIQKPNDHDYWAYNFDRHDHGWNKFIDAKTFYDKYMTILSDQRYSITLMLYMAPYVVTPYYGSLGGYTPRDCRAETGYVGIVNQGLSCLFLELCLWFCSLFIDITFWGYKYISSHVIYIPIVLYIYIYIYIIYDLCV